MQASRHGKIRVLLLGCGVPVVASIVCNVAFPDLATIQLPLHSAMEALGVFSGLSLAILLLFMEKRRTEAPYYLWIASALIGMAILDGFHASLPTGNSFVWLHSIAILVGGLVIAMVWLPGPAAQSKEASIFPGLVAAGAIMLGMFSVAVPEKVPAMLTEGYFTNAASGINVAAGFFFIVAALFFLVGHRVDKGNEDILFAFFCLLNGTAGFLFPFSEPWQVAWWLWHLLRVAAYFILLAYVFIAFRQSEVEARRAFELANAEIVERKKAEEALTKHRDHLEEMVAQRTADLTKVLKEVQEAVNSLAPAAAEILAAATQVASGTAETATAVAETTTTVEEVKQTAQVASEKAKYVSESAQKGARVAQDGKKAVEANIENMNHIREQIESIAESIIGLSEQGQAIGEITATVTDIAEQVNLLSVNAAIEAARAGEHGKGFGVVAQEIKSLAEQAKHATVQVRTILTDVQKGISRAVMVTEQGGKAAEIGVKQTADAGEAIRRLADSIAEAAQAAIQIAASNQQQLVGMDQVASAMENIKQATTESITSTKEVERTARNLHELSQRLKESAEQVTL